MALSDNLVFLLTRSRAELAKEQLRNMYLRIYPYIIDDFPHKDDLKTAFVAIEAELSQIKSLLQSHIHPQPPVGGAPTPPAIVTTPVNPAVIPKDITANSLIVPGGVPQPVGGSISIQPSRRDINPIATPPINPLDPSA